MSVYTAVWGNIDHHNEKRFIHTEQQHSMVLYYLLTFLAFFHKIAYEKSDATIARGSTRQGPHSSLGLRLETGCRLSQRLCCLCLCATATNSHGRVGVSVYRIGKPRGRGLVSLHVEGTVVHHQVQMLFGVY